MAAQGFPYAQIVQGGGGPGLLCSVDAKPVVGSALVRFPGSRGVNHSTGVDAVFVA